MKNGKTPTEFNIPEVTNQLDTTPEDLYAEHRRAATAANLANVAFESTDAHSFKQFETGRVAIAKDKYDSNIERASDHYRQNQATYHDQALADSQAVGVEIKQ